MNYFESVFSAFDSIKQNKLRSSLTLLSVAIGVFAIFGSGTLVRSIDDTVENKLNELGENTFLVKRTPSVQMGRHSWRKYRSRPRIRYPQVEQLQTMISQEASISAFQSQEAQIIKSRYIDSDPDITVAGVDGNYFWNYDESVAKGRVINSSDVGFRKNVAVVGLDIVRKLFPSQAMGEMIRIGSQQYEIVGILEEKGAVLGKSQDNKVLIPISSFLKYNSSWWSSLDITVKAKNQESLSDLVDETIGALRSIRNVKPWEDNNFEIETNESISEQFASLTVYLQVFGWLVGMFSLIAAGIGIANIMLVSIKERTKEIGVRVAVGAKRKWILQQFLVETLTICQIGGIIGILMGIATGFLFSSLFGMSMIIPVDLIIFSIIITTVLGTISGLYPSYKASKLNPIDALRYE